MIFTDGAENEAGSGSSATVLIPLEAGDQEVGTTPVHTTCILTCSLETEIAAIALAVEQVVDCYSWNKC